MIKGTYTEDNIRSLDWKEHIRLRPGMYIGKLGDGSSQDDGIYVLIKEIIDNSIDEYFMGFGKKIEINIKDNVISIRDYGRGLPLKKLVDCVSKINTGGKYDDKAFQKSVGLNGVGTKAVNALSSFFKITSFREGQSKSATFEKGVLKQEGEIIKTNQKNGTLVEFRADETIFKNYMYNDFFIEKLIQNYAFLNTGLILIFNEKKFYSKEGLKDLLNTKVEDDTLYPIIHIKDSDIEIAFSHTENSREEYFTFVNGQYTSQGGTHLSAFKESMIKTIRDFYKRNFDASDIKTNIIAAISVRIQEPIFESQTKTKLGSQYIAPNGISIKNFISNFLQTKLDDYLHKNPNAAETILNKILQSERERREIAGIKKLANERAKKANIHNKKLRDCRVHLNTKNEKRLETMIFLTEGNSASGSITKSRNVLTQAVFSLRGKPLNCYDQSKKIIYENEEFNLLQHALNIENGLEGLKYNKVIISTDADVDGMHIRLLLMTYFLKFFPKLIKSGHLFILETPLFRVRNKNETIYCYSDLEKDIAINKLGKAIEITRFKGLGEISPHEFKDFINENIKLTPVHLSNEFRIDNLLNFYMGRNSFQRQNFIIDNLRSDVN